MNHVLITGGAGFIGSNLALKLIEKGYSVTVIDNLNKQIHGENPTKSYTYNLVKDKVNFIHGDVTNIEDLKKALKNIDVIVHLAAETGTGQSMYEINSYVDTNIGSTAKIFELLTNGTNTVKKFIIASSRSVYGEGKYSCSSHGIVYPEARLDQHMAAGDFEVKCPICLENAQMLPTDEDSKLHPSSVYGFTKLAQEQLSMISGTALNIPVISYRFQNVYGPGQSLKNAYTGILSIFSNRIKNGNGINIFEDGLESRDFVYIDDVTDAVILGIEHDTKQNYIFNVGSGELVDVTTVANVLKDNYDSDVEIAVSGNYRIGDIRHNIADLTQINTVLGYEPKVKFNEGISKFVQWVEKQEVEVDNYEKSIDELKEKGLYK